MDSATGQTQRVAPSFRFLASQIRRHHDADVVVRSVTGGCHLLLRFPDLGSMFGVATLSADDRTVQWDFRTTSALPPDARDRAGQLFEAKNRRREPGHWSVANGNGEIRFTGELRLNGGFGDKRRLRRGLLRPLEQMRRRLGPLFAAGHEE